MSKGMSMKKEQKKPRRSVIVSRPSNRATSPPSRGGLVPDPQSPRL